jgi:formate C-acetyltransferase
MGGLNVKFGGKMPREHFIAMLDVFFEMGCVQVGYTCVDRSMLLAAQSKPNQHRNLCVRITGFSEYFVSLSPEAQQDLIERTEYV